MSKHTPGPWKPVILDEGFVSIDDAEGHQLAEVYTSANASLIAAAPDLLEALEAVIAEYRDGHGYGYGLNCAERVRAAIAKATGEA